MNKMPNLYKGATLTDKINAFGKSMASKQTEAHKLALSVLQHVALHKNTNVVSHFLMVMPDMLRTNGLRAWFEEFGPVKIIADEASGVEQVLYVKDKPVRLAEAHMKPFYKFVAKEGKPYVPVDLGAEVERLIKKLVADQAKGDKVDHGDAIKALRALAGPRKPMAVPADQATVDPLADIQ